MAQGAAFVIGGVDTHGRSHHAALIDEAGRVLGSAEFVVSTAGYRRLLHWMRGHGAPSKVGVEGTGTYGAGLCRYLARRSVMAEGEVKELDAALSQLVRRAAPRTIALRAIGVDHAGQFLVTAGERPERLRSEAAFARLCGAAPIPASSGRTRRHRLHRGGDRAANRALHPAVVVRLRCCPRTRRSVERRTAEGLSRPGIRRCLKRYPAREVFRTLTADLRELHGLDGI